MKSERALILLSKFAPRLAAPGLARLFTTPQRFDAPPAERAQLRGGERFTVESPSGSIAAWRWGSGPNVVLFHGWSGRGGQLGAFVGPLVAAGFTAVLFDAPAHGESGPEQATMVDFARALRAVVETVGGARAVIGHSMGASSTAYALSQGLRPERVVLIGTPTTPMTYSRTFARKLGLSEAARAAMQRSLEHGYGVNWEGLSVPRIAQSQSTPLLLVHDRQDRDTAFAGAEEVARNWRGSELMATEGLGHRKILRDPAVIARVVEFIGAL